MTTNYLDCGEDYLDCGQDYLDCGQDYLDCGQDYLDCSNDVLDYLSCDDDEVITDTTTEDGPIIEQCPSNGPYYQPPRKDSWFAELFYAVIVWINNLFNSISRGIKWLLEK